MRFVLTVVAVTTAVVVSVYWFLLRPWHLRWGATDDEVARALPGDEMVPHPRLTATHALTIQAPPDQVWPWLVQIGQGRAGFYSYESIENLMGADIHNSNRLLPQFQTLHVGDAIPLAGDGTSIPVAAVEPNHLLILGGRVDARNKPDWFKDQPDAFFETSWVFLLEPVDRGTRLTERFRLNWGPDSLRNTLYYRALLEPGSFIMERRMLLGIQERAENSPP